MASQKTNGGHRRVRVKGGQAALIRSHCLSGHTGKEQHLTQVLPVGPLVALHIE